jgi:CheY-like chemotaxis protein
MSGTAEFREELKMARILVLEDESNQRLVMADLLVRSGHEARCTADPRTAIEAAHSFKPDVLVADWVLRTQLTGRDVAEILRSANPALRIVFITAMPAGVVESDAAGLEPFKIVQKPCEFYDLLTAIHEVLGDVPTAEAAVR